MHNIFKYQLLLTLCLGSIMPGFGSPTPLTENQKLALLAKSWGLMKYYHPVVGQGSINWDSVLVKYIPMTRETRFDRSFNKVLTKLFQTLPPVSFKHHKQACAPYKTETLANFAWTQSSKLSKNNRKILTTLLGKTSWHKNKYVSDSSKTRALGYARFYEDPMKNADLERVEIRLLGLFRYWNIIEYFFPYKNLADTPWSEVLTTYIPQFIAAKNTKEYYTVLLKLSTKINDAHANIPYHPQLRSAFFGRYTIPFRMKFVENRLVVNRITSDSLARFAHIQQGDIITHIEGQSALQKIQQLGQFLPASNPAYHYQQICQYILNGNSETLHLQVLRNNTSRKLIIPRYTFATLRKHRNKKLHKTWEILPSTIAYAHMGHLNKKDLTAFFQGIRHTKGLILDFRAYPNWQVFFPFLSHFYQQKKSFALLKSQCLAHPGTFYWHAQSARDLSEIHPVKTPYHKPIILLVDENTLSFGEYFVMALQNLQNVKVVGSQTAGEDGNQAGIDMPGGIRMFMSSLGIYYPDGSNSQRTGVKIDYLVPTSLQEIKTQKDAKLSYAIKLLNKN